ncbi:putative Natriuretic peptide Na-NP protein, partial [Naja naja]
MVGLSRLVGGGLLLVLALLPLALDGKPAPEALHKPPTGLRTSLAALRILEYLRPDSKQSRAARPDAAPRAASRRRRRLASSAGRDQRREGLKLLRPEDRPHRQHERHGLRNPGKASAGSTNCPGGVADLRVFASRQQAVTGRQGPDGAPRAASRRRRQWRLACHL